MDNKDSVSMKDVREYIKKDNNPNKRFLKISRVIVVAFILLATIPHLFILIKTNFIDDYATIQETVIDDKIYSVGETVSASDFDITVADINYPATFGNVTEDTYGKFAEIKVSVKNTSDKKHMTSLILSCITNNLYCVRKEEYENSCNNDTLKAGETKTYTYVFSIPKDSSNLKIQLDSKTYSSTIDTTYQYLYSYKLKNNIH